MRKSLVRLGAVVGIVVGTTVIGVPAHGGTPHVTFRAYTVTDGTNPVSGGEPSIGYDPIRDAVIFGADAHETRMVFDPHDPSRVTQTDVSAPSAVTTLDSITLSFVDQRTFGGWLLADLVTVDGLRRRCPTRP